MKRLLTLLLACTALVAAGCGGDEEEDPAPAGGGAATQEDTGSGSGEASGEGLTIAMKDFKFDPKNATVKVGQTVTWTNEDSAPHNAVDEKGGAFKSELFNKGETYEFTAEKAGKIDYVCTIHPGMEGTLTVTE
jgi:plastocyanin